MVNKTRAAKCTFTVFLLVTFYFNSQAQDDLRNQRLMRDSSLGIVISAHEFDSLVDALLIKFNSDESEKKVEDYLSLIRVGNTIAFDQPYDSSPKHKELLNPFLFKYMNKIENLTDATVSIGYSLYSKKYDLQIGGVKTESNYYRIIHYAIICTSIKR